VGADIESVCRKASMLAIREFIESEGKDYSKFLISGKHFKEALSVVSGQKTVGSGQ